MSPIEVATVKCCASLPSVNGKLPVVALYAEATPWPYSLYAWLPSSLSVFKFRNESCADGLLLKHRDTFGARLQREDVLFDLDFLDATISLPWRSRFSKESPRSIFRPRFRPVIAPSHTNPL